MAEEDFSQLDTQSPLYLHPSQTNIPSLGVKKLQGESDYRLWRRSMEIALGAMGKLGFVTGEIEKDKEDEQRAQQWEACNSMVLIWIHASLSESIKKSIFYVDSAHEVWRRLEAEFGMPEGFMKYELMDKMMATQQNGRSVCEYYSILKGFWLEEDSMNVLPPVTEVTAETTALISAVETQKDERRLLQFLKGVDDEYRGLRAEMLMRTPLPSVKEAYRMLQQKEMIRDVTSTSKGIICCSVSRLMKRNRSNVALYFS